MVSHIRHEWIFHDKPTQGAEFKIFWDQYMGVAESQDPGSGKPKNSVKIKEVSMVRRPLGMRHLPINKYG